MGDDLPIFHAAEALRLTPRRGDSIPKALDLPINRTHLRGNLVLCPFLVPFLPIGVHCPLMSTFFHGFM